MNAVATTAAFATGLATSLHCAGMCGPLACAVRARPLNYHAGRFASYTLLGGLAGWIGEPVVNAMHSAPARILPWAMATVLVLVAFGLEKRIPQPRWFTAWFLRLRLRNQLGFLTPLIPCGPLWLMLGVAGTSGGLPQGAAMLAAFSAGTVPLFLLIQGGMLRLGPRFSPRVLSFFQRSVALLAATVLVWRAMLPDAHACCHH